MKSCLHALKCISAAAVVVNEVTRLWIWLHTRALFHLLSSRCSMLTRCFSAAGLEQVSKTCTYTCICPAYQSSHENFCSQATSDEQLLKPFGVAVGDFFLCLESKRRTIADLSEKALVPYKIKTIQKFVL